MQGRISSWWIRLEALNPSIFVRTQKYLCLPPFVCCLSVDLFLSCAVFLSFPLLLFPSALAFFCLWCVLSCYSSLSLVVSLRPPSLFFFFFLTYLLLSGACQVWVGFIWMAIFNYRPPLHIEVLSGLFESKVMRDWIDLYGVIWWKSLIYIPDSLRWKSITHSMYLGELWERVNVVCGENKYSRIYMYCLLRYAIVVTDLISFDCP